MSLVFDVLARDQASRTFRQVGDEAERTGVRATSGLGSIVNAAKVAGAALLGAGIIEGFQKLYGAADESQRIGRLTEQAIRSTGGAAQISAAQVGDLAAAISAKTGIDDEAIQSGQNLLLSFTRIRNEVGAGNDIFNQASSVLADMSVRLGTDASGSAIQLGKALNDPIAGIGSLSRAGVQFTEQQKDQIRTLVESGDVLGAQKVILAELTTQFGGAAAAAATPLDRMKVSVGNIAEAVGGALIPVVNDFATGAITAIEGVSEGFQSGEVTAAGFEGAMQQVGVTVGDAADGVGFLVDVGGKLISVLDSVPGPVLAGVAAMAGFSALKGPVTDALETIYLRSLLTRDGLAAAGGGMGVLKSGASGLVGLLGGPWGIAVGAATVGLGFLTAGLADSDEAAEATAAAQRTFADAVREANGAINESTRAAAAKAAQDAGLLDLADGIGVSLSRVTDAALGNASAYADVDSAIESYLQNILRANGQNTEDAMFLAATENAAALRSGLQELAPTVDDVRQEQEALGEATAQTDGAQGAAAVTAQTLAASQQQLADDTNAAKQAVDGIRLALEQLGGQTVDTTELESQFYAAITDASGALTGLEGDVLNAAGAFDVQSEKGRAAAEALLNIRSTGLDLIANQAELGETTEQLSGRANALRESFIRTADEMGIGAAEANRLADQYGLIPGDVVTTVVANSSQARNTIADVQAQLTALNGRTVSVTVLATAATSAISGVFGFPKRAAGGPVTAGETYLVGEEGAELFRAKADGFITPADQTERVLAAGERAPRPFTDAGEPVGAASTGPRTVIHDNRQVFAQVDARGLSRQMQRDQADLEYLHG